MRKRNWKEYNRQLVQRGSLTFLIDPKLIKSTENVGLTRQRGRPRQFTDHLIVMLMMLKIQYRLAYRALEGFARSVQQLSMNSVPIPTYSAICKRAARLERAVPKLSSRRPSVVIMDSSGVKVFGEGEWKVRVHGKSKRRKWLKVHVAIDAKTQEIVAEVTTDSSVTDGKVAPDLLEQVCGRVETVMADGAYDGRDVREAIRNRGAQALIPPPKNGRLKGDIDRDQALRIIHGAGGNGVARSLWGKLTGYSLRSLVEATFSRLKRLFGERLFSKILKKQRLEISLKCLILNKMRSQAA